MLKRDRLRKGLSVFLIVTGILFLLYPGVSQLWNRMFQSRAVVSYEQTGQQLDDGLRRQMLWIAERYNRTLSMRKNGFALNVEQREQYPVLLSLDELGTMGTIEIPSIHCSLPIYHGTTEPVLQRGVGHLEWSSLPVGGASTHCVLTAHRGLSNARMFTDLGWLEVGDTFTVTVLDRVMIYEVFEIQVVEPWDASALQIRDGEDLCTLVTCTPYGINTHRLLIQGKRVS